MIGILFLTSCASLLGLIGRNIGTSIVTDNHISELPRFLHCIFLPGHSCTPQTLLLISLDGFRWDFAGKAHTPYM